MKNIKSLLLVLLALMSIADVFADYPIAGYRYLADPGALVHDGRVYLYCSNDDDNDGNYHMRSIVCISSSDMKNWTDHGVVFEVPEDAAWASYSWAPGPIYRNGKFYIYWGNSGNGVGVCVADSPTGPFKDPIGRELISRSTPGANGPSMWLFDPGAFIDDDGQAYIYFGGNGDNNMRVMKLNEDMISVSGTASGFTVPNFFEAAWMHKHEGVYYFSYSATPSSGTTIDYMTSDNPMTGFTHKGAMSPQPPENSNNNHHSTFKFNGEWYQAYHNRIVSRQAGISSTYKRNIAMDKIFHEPDGTIRLMVNTVDGLDQLSYINPYERVEAETMSDQNGIETEVCSAGGMNLGYLNGGDWTMVEGVDFGTIGANSFTASVASPNDGGTIEIRLGGTSGTLIGTVAVPNTGGFQDWQEVTIPVSSTTDVHNLYFVFSGGFNVDHWHFTEMAGAPEVSIVSPFDQDTLFTGDETTIDVSVSDEDGTITNVFYYINDELIQEEWNAPYAFTYTFETAGEYTIRAVATDNDGNKRQDELTVNVYVPQGPYNNTAHLIPGLIELEEYDLGGNGFAYFDDSPGSETGVDFRTDEDVDIEECTDNGGGYNIGWATAGEWLEYTVDVQGAGVYDLDFRVAKDGEDGVFHLEIDGQNITGDVEVPNTGGWQTWETETVEDVTLSEGEHVIRLVFDTQYININYMEFKSLITKLNNGEIETAKLYPNPVEDQLTITLTNIVSTTVSITTLEGKELLSKSINGNKTTIDVSTLPEGQYILSLSHSDLNEVFTIVR